jgi:hypothetical protein
VVREPFLDAFQALGRFENAVLAIIFAWMALRAKPVPVPKDCRLWAKTGLALGAIVLIAIPALIILNFEGLRAIIEALEKLCGK